MRYLNTTTLKQTTEYLDSTTVIDTDPRVSNWFKSKPVGENGEEYKGQWIDGTYSFTMIPLATQEELEAIEALSIVTESIAKAQAYLDKTDHKFFNRYKAKATEDLVAIEAQRDLDREYIRSNR